MTKRDRIEMEKVIAAIRAVFQKVMKSAELKTKITEAKKCKH